MDEGWIQKDEIDLIKETDEIIDRKLKGLREEIDKKKSKEFQEKGKISKDAEANLKALEKKYQQLKEYLLNEKSMMEELINENKEQEKQIQSLKNDVLSKIKLNTADVDNQIKEVREVPEKIKLLSGRP